MQQFYTRHLTGLASIVDKEVELDFSDLMPNEAPDEMTAAEQHAETFAVHNGATVEVRTDPITPGKYFTLTQLGRYRADTANG